MKAKPLHILPVFLLGLYVATRRKYSIPDFSIFIPNTEIFTGSTSFDREKILKILYNSTKIKLTTEPHLGWIFSFKPIDGIQIPVSVWLPWDFPVIYPQVKAKMGESLIIEAQTLGSQVLGYQVEVKNLSFYA